MNRLLPISLLAVALGGCSSLERTQPPAPVVNAGSNAAEATPAQPVGPAPAEGAVEVFAYRPPTSAPDASEPPGAVPAESAGPAGAGLVSESAVPSGMAAPTAPQIVAYASQPPPAPSMSPAASALVQQAERQRQSRDYVGAAATLERALGIQPQEPYVWNRLARVRMEQGLYAQAGNLATRSNALAGNQASLKQDNWSIIAAARRAVGDTAGAMEAERKAHGG